MRVLSDLLMKSSTVVLSDEVDFPASPSLGQFCFTGGILYIYATINTITSWFPLTNKINYYVHSQGLPAVEWTVEHNLGSTDLIFIIYDEYNSIQFSSDSVFTSSNVLTLSFSVAVKGKVVVFAASGSTVGGGAGGGGISWTKITAATTAVKSNGYICDTSGSAFTLTLPASPATGDAIQIVDGAGTFDSANLTIGRNTKNIMGLAENLVVSTKNASFGLVYADATNGWRIS
jgi:hypothetical protein